MSILKIGSIAVAAILASVIALCVVSYITAHNYGAQAEQQIIAAWENNENILGQYSLQVMEAGSVPSMMRDDMKEVLQATFEGRYGPDGSRAVFQWIQEQNPNVTSDIYIKVQQIIESGRNGFTNAMTQSVDKKRQYETQLRFMWRGFWLAKAGYPTIDLDSFKVISTVETREAFQTGIGQPVQFGN